MLGDAVKGTLIVELISSVAFPFFHYCCPLFNSAVSPSPPPHVQSLVDCLSDWQRRVTERPNRLLKTPFLTASFAFALNVKQHLWGQMRGYLGLAQQAGDRNVSVSSVFRPTFRSPVFMPQKWRLWGWICFRWTQQGKTAFRAKSIMGLSFLTWK